MADNPAVSILMGVYNEERYLDEAIESVLDQTFEDYEFLIIDDSSTDRSPEIADSYGDDRIELIRNDANQGLTASLNRALELATGEYIARQDADDISEPDRLERQVAFLEDNEEIALVGTGAYLIDGDGSVIDRRIPYRTPDFRDFLEKSHLVHGSILARRSVIESLGGYDEFFRYGQDYDLWLRLSKQYNVANIPDHLYRHRIHDEGVYFSRKDESALYGQLARDIATGDVGRDIKSELSDITDYYTYLNSEKRAAFHTDLATRYLRYGHTEPAIEECRKALEYDRFLIRPYLLTGLAHAGPHATTVVRRGMRRYLNLKTRIRNRFTQL